MLERIKEALLSIGLPIFNYWPLDQDGDYIVYGDDGDGESQYADNRKGERSRSGTIDLFTKTPNDPMADSLEESLDDIELSYRKNSLQFEIDTRFFHHEWIYQYAEGE